MRFVNGDFFENEDQARTELEASGYTFEAFPGGIEELKARYQDVWDMFVEQGLRGEIVWDSERSGVWFAPHARRQFTPPEMSVPEAISLVAAAAVAGFGLYKLFQPPRAA